MSSTEAKKAAREYLVRQDNRFLRESYMPECFDELVALLAEARLSEHSRLCSTCIWYRDGKLKERCEYGSELEAALAAARKEK